MTTEFLYWNCIWSPFVIWLKILLIHTVVCPYLSICYIYILVKWIVFANGLGDLGSIPDCAIPKTLKIVLDTCLLNTQWYKVYIKGKVEQSRERSSTSPTPWCSSYWKETLLVANFTYLYLHIVCILGSESVSLFVYLTQMCLLQRLKDFKLVEWYPLTLHISAFTLGCVNLPVPNKFFFCELTK